MLVLTRFVLLLVLLFATPAWAQFPAAGQAKLMPGSSLKDPGGNPAAAQAMFTYSNHYLDFYTGGNSSNVFAFSGFAYDTTRNKIVAAWTGGHADSADNSVYELDAHTPAWSRVRDASFYGSCDNLTPCQGESTGAYTAYYTDGGGVKWPASIHSYQGEIYMPWNNKVWVGGGRVWITGNPIGIVWFYDPVTKTQVLQSDGLSDALDISGVWDPHQQVILYHGHSRLWVYDPKIADGTGARNYYISGDEGDWSQSDQGAFFDWKRRRFISYGFNNNFNPSGNKISYYNLIGGDVCCVTRIDQTYTGDMPPMDGSFRSLGALYDVIRDKYIFWMGYTSGTGSGGSNVIYEMDPDTFVTTAKVLTGDSIPAQGGQVTGLQWGRFFHNVADDVYLLLQTQQSNIVAMRHPDQTRVFAAPNKTLVTKDLWAWGNGPFGVKSGGPNAGKLNRWLVDYTRNQVVWTAGDYQYYYPTNTSPFTGSVLGQSSGTIEMWRGNFAATTPSFTQIVTEFAPATTGVMPGEPINVSFAYDLFNDDYLMLPGFYRDGGTPRFLTNAILAGDGPGATITLTGDISGSNWTDPANLYVWQSGVSVGGDQEIISVHNKVGQTYQIVSRRAMGSTGGTGGWSAGASVVPIGTVAYPTLNPLGPVADYGPYVMNPTVQSDGWAHWRYPGFTNAPASGYGGDTGATFGTWDRHPTGTKSFYRAYSSGVVQKLDRSSLPGTWSEFGIGDGAPNFLAADMDAVHPAVGEQLYISSSVNTPMSDDILWPPSGLLMVGRPEDGGSTLEWVAYSAKNVGTNSVTVSQRGATVLRSNQPTDGTVLPFATTAQAHVAGGGNVTRVLTPNAALAGVYFAFAQMANDIYGQAMYLVAHTGGNYGLEFGPDVSDWTIPFQNCLAKLDINPASSTYKRTFCVAKLPIGYDYGIGLDDPGTNKSSVAEQRLFFDPLNRILIMPNNVAQWGGPTSHWYVYHIDTPTMLYNLSSDPGWEEIPIPGGTLGYSTSQGGVMDDIHNLLGWFPYNNTQYTTFRYYGGPTTQPPVTASTISINGTLKVGAGSTLKIGGQ